MDEMSDLLALPKRRAAALAGISLRQLDYWTDTLLVPAAVDEKLSPRRRVRLYDTAALTEVLVAAELRNRHDLTVQHVRRVVDHLRSRRYVAPLREVRFAVAGSEIHFKLPDGSWEGEFQPKQLVLAETLDLAPVRARIDRAARRPADAAGKIDRGRRGRLGGVPVFAGTRIPVAIVQSYLDENASTEQILRAFPALTEQDIAAISARIHRPGSGALQMPRADW